VYLNVLNSTLNQVNGEPYWQQQQQHQQSFYSHFTSQSAAPAKIKAFMRAEFNCLTLADGNSCT